MGSPVPGCDSPTQQLTFPNPPSNKLPHTVFGAGPVYWGGQPVWHTSGEEGVVIIDSAVTVPVTVTFSGPAGGTATLGGKSSVIIQPVSDEWAYDEDMFSPSVAGCWSMHATYGGKTLTVNFTVVSGSPPPG